MMIKVKKLYKERKALNLYTEHYNKNKNTIIEIMKYYNSNNEKAAIWGAGLKGIAFLSIFDFDEKIIRCVYDIDTSKYGNSIVNGHEITGINDEKHSDITVIYLMNPNFESEIAGIIKKSNRKVKLFNIDSIIFGKVSFDEAIELYGRYI